MSSPDPYESLGIPKFSSAVAIEGAYSTLIMQYNDQISVSGTDKLTYEAKIGEINRAKKVLLDPELQKCFTGNYHASQAWRRVEEIEVTRLNKKFTKKSENKDVFLIKLRNLSKDFRKRKFERQNEMVKTKTQDQDDNVDKRTKAASEPEPETSRRSENKHINRTSTNTEKNSDFCEIVEIVTHHPSQDSCQRLDKGKTQSHENTQLEYKREDKVKDGIEKELIKTEALNQLLKEREQDWNLALQDMNKNKANLENYLELAKMEKKKYEERLSKLDKEVEDKFVSKVEKAVCDREKELQTEFKNKKQQLIDKATKKMQAAVQVWEQRNENNQAIITDLNQKVNELRMQIEKQNKKLIVEKKNFDLEKSKLKESFAEEKTKIRASCKSKIESIQAAHALELKATTMETTRRCEIELKSRFEIQKVELVETMKKNSEEALTKQQMELERKYDVANTALRNNIVTLQINIKKQQEELEDEKRKLEIEVSKVRQEFAREKSELEAIFASKIEIIEATHACKIQETVVKTTKRCEMELKSKFQSERTQLINQMDMQKSEALAKQATELTIKYDEICDALRKEVTEKQIKIERLEEQLKRDHQQFINEKLHLETKFTQQKSAVTEEFSSKLEEVKQEWSKKLEEECNRLCTKKEREVTAKLDSQLVKTLNRQRMEFIKEKNASVGALEKQLEDSEAKRLEVACKFETLQASKIENEEHHKRIIKELQQKLKLQEKFNMVTSKLSTVREELNVISEQLVSSYNQAEVENAEPVLPVGMRKPTNSIENQANN